MVSRAQKKTKLQGSKSRGPIPSGNAAPVGQLTNRLFSLAAFAAGCLVAVVVQNAIRRHAGGDEMLAAHRNVILLSQQLEQLSKRFFQKQSADLDVDELRTWLLFDDRFVEENRDSPLFRFETATTARRAGVIAVTLGKFNEARPQFAAANELYHALREEHPENFTYMTEHMWLYYSMAHLHASEGDLASAREVTSKAMDTILSDPVTVNAEREESLATLLAELSKLAHRLGDKKLAQEIADRHLTGLDLLQARSPNDPTFHKMREASMEMLTEFEGQSL